MIRVVAAFTTDTAGRILLVRKQGSQIFMQPGGKPEPGESAAGALIREVAEELQVEVSATDLLLRGTFETDAANEPGHRLVAEVFDWSFQGEPRPAAEIAEARWFTPAEVGDLGARLAPLARLLIDREHPISDVAAPG